jgi:catechol 2,3-dioxygenase-like lactoylglutathione lyase family enzyme
LNISALNGIHHVTAHVTDMRRAANWYARTLGYQPSWSSSKALVQWLRMSHLNGVLVLDQSGACVGGFRKVQDDGERHMTRSPEGAYRAHLQAVNSGDLDGILQNYADDAVILTAQGPLEGRAGVEGFFKQAFSLLPKAQVSAKQVVYSGAALLVWWGAESPAGRVDDGVDTFLFERGLIKLQSISFTPQLSQ